MLLVNGKNIPVINVPCAEMVRDTHWPYKFRRCTHDANVTSEKAVVVVEITEDGHVMVHGVCGTHINKNAGDDHRTELAKR